MGSVRRVLKMIEGAPGAERRKLGIVGPVRRVKGMLFEASQVTILRECRQWRALREKSATLRLAARWFIRRLRLAVRCRQKSRLRQDGLVVIASPLPSRSGLEGSQIRPGGVRDRGDQRYAYVLANQARNAYFLTGSCFGVVGVGTSRRLAVSHCG